MHILPKRYYLKRTLFDDKAVEIFLRKKADFGGKKVKKGHAQTLLSSDCTFSDKGKNSRGNHETPQEKKKSMLLG